MSALARLTVGVGGVALVGGLVIAGTGPTPEAFAASVTGYGYGELVDRSAPLYRTLDELLPTVTYVEPDGTHWPGAEMVVVGRAVAVEPGRSGKDLGNDTWVESNFDDPDAWSRTVHAVIEVESALGSTDAPEQVVVGFAISPEVGLDDAAAWFSDAGRLVLVLTESAVFDYDPEVWGVVLDGTMVARIAPDGTLTMPFTPDREADRLLKRTPTLAALEVAAGEPRIIELVDCGGFPCRSRRD